MSSTRCTRYFVQLLQTEMRLRSELRRRSYRFLNRLTDDELQFRDDVLLCRRDTHSPGMSVLWHSSRPMALVSTDTFFKLTSITTLLSFAFTTSGWNRVSATLLSIEESIYLSIRSHIFGVGVRQNCFFNTLSTCIEFEFDLQSR